MKCTKCGYTSFDYLDSCKKCGEDLSSEKVKLNLYVKQPVLETDSEGFILTMIKTEKTEELTSADK